MLLNKVGGLKPHRSKRHIKFRKVFNCDAGQLIPVICKMAIPGDIWKINCDIVARMQPTLAPILHEINIEHYAFFVPMRPLFSYTASGNPTITPNGLSFDEGVFWNWNQWERFYTRSVKGDEYSSNGSTGITIPKWIPTNNPPLKYSLWDYMGFGMGDGTNLITTTPDTNLPVDLPKRAYNFVWNEYFRDQNLQIPINLSNTIPDIIRNCCWKGDYFTRSLPFAQRGSAGSLPLAGYTYADFTNVFPGDAVPIVPTSIVGAFNITQHVGSGAFFPTGSYPDTSLRLVENLNQNVVNMNNVSTFDVNDLRTIVQLQKSLERNARIGNRYTEVLQGRWGISPTDERLNRPEFIGRTKQPIIISEVLKTSEDGNDPQGNLAGHGLSANIGSFKPYRVKEWGIILSILVVRPRAGYHQGIDREWQINSVYDLPTPEFMHLGERPIKNSELLITNSHTYNNGDFGFRGMYDEYRYGEDKACADLRPGQLLDYWTLTRDFSYTSPPLLNSDFVTLNGSTPSMKRIFAVQNEPGYIIHTGVRANVIRPLPTISEPGLMDHF